MKLAQSPENGINSSNANFKEVPRIPCQKKNQKKTNNQKERKRSDYKCAAHGLNGLSVQGAERLVREIHVEVEQEKRMTAANFKPIQAWQPCGFPPFRKLWREQTI